MNAKKLSSEIIEVVPDVMRIIRDEMRGGALSDLSMGQFRILAKLDRQPQSNKQLAEWVGISTAAMSRTIELMVGLGYIQRKAAVEDRREVVLGLTPQGRKKYESIKELAQLKLASRLGGYPAEDLKKLHRSLQFLSEVFSAKKK